MFGNQTNEHTGRVKCDYRETISDLMSEVTLPLWVKWSHDHGFITRNEAHGSPGNLLDLYALADVPETHRLAGASALPHASGDSAVTVATSAASISWHGTGMPVPATPSNDTPHPITRMSVVDGVTTCSTVFVVAATRATSTTR
jgi:hypothetical protein